MEFDDLQTVPEPPYGVLGGERVTDDVVPPLALPPRQGIGETDQTVVRQQCRHRAQIPTLSVPAGVHGPLDRRTRWIRLVDVQEGGLVDADDIGQPGTHPRGCPADQPDALHQACLPRALVLTTHHVDRSAVGWPLAGRVRLVHHLRCSTITGARSVAEPAQVGTGTRVLRRLIRSGPSAR